MTIKKWQPFSDLMNIYDRMNRLFEDELYQEPRRSGMAMSNWIPLTDIYETKESFIFKMELPGFRKDDINVEFDGNNLVLRGERKQEEELKNENCHRIERSYGTFQRSFQMPKNIDSGKISATLVDGILHLVVPKIEEAKTKAIPITVK